MQGYTHEEVEALCVENNRSIEEFDKWMIGQTVGEVDGKAIYYIHDVDRFFKRLPIID